MFLELSFHYELLPFLARVQIDRIQIEAFLTYLVDYYLVSDISGAKKIRELIL